MNEKIKYLRYAQLTLIRFHVAFANLNHNLLDGRIYLGHPILERFHVDFAKACLSNLLHVFEDGIFD